jgi:hypothetical protein
VILGLDGGNTRTGAAVIDPEHPERIHVRVFTPDDDPVGCARAVLTWVHELDAPIHLVGAEEHAFTASAKQIARTKRSNQGEIAWKLGWISGVVGGVVAFDRRAKLVSVPVSTWRASMLARIRADNVTRATSGRARRLRDDVEVLRGAGEALVVRYVNCGHLWTAPDLNALTRGRPDLCPTCNGPAPRADDDDAMKRAAVEAALAAWPDPFGALVAATRKRARSNAEAPPHQLVGVSDAAEAAWIAWHLTRER